MTLSKVTCLHIPEVCVCVRPEYKKNSSCVQLSISCSLTLLTPISKLSSVKGWLICNWRSEHLTPGAGDGVAHPHVSTLLESSPAPPPDRPTDRRQLPDVAHYMKSSSYFLRAVSNPPSLFDVPCVARSICGIRYHERERERDAMGYRCERPPFDWNELWPLC